MPSRFLGFWTAVLLAAVVSVDISPDAVAMLLSRTGGEKDVRIAEIFYS